ncbi:MAG TPA: ribulose-phosphate 3-epimerase [Elusimicrobiota bacterium]|nr:ribulose-phosphate 3-epimerase [Elusimicrobiota bacterium]
MACLRPSAKPIRIAPSILSADFSRLGESVKVVERAGADWIHVDVMDGHFVPNLTVGPAVVKSLSRVTSLKQDVHLMIEDPVHYIPIFAEAGSWLITFHLEAVRSPEKAVRLIRKHGCLAGMSVRPKTPIQKLFPYLPLLDLVLIMTVEPGFGGQSFMADMLPKISLLRDRLTRIRKPCWIQVDGGIGEKTASRVVQAGANVLVAGTAIFAQKDPARALKALRAECLG